MADPGDPRAREGDPARPDKRADPAPGVKPPSRSPFTGITLAILVVVLAVVAIAFIGRGLVSEDIGGEVETGALTLPAA